jgi:hypothetical protein
MCVSRGSTNQSKYKAITTLPFQIIALANRCLGDIIGFYPVENQLSLCVLPTILTYMATAREPPATPTAIPTTPRKRRAGEPQTPRTTTRTQKLTLANVEDDDAISMETSVTETNEVNSTPLTTPSKSKSSRATKNLGK